MKLDIVRAWKDESYRQDLSEEQLNTLPANPSGELELTDSDLESVYGGGNSFGWSAGHSRTENIHSYAVICDINLFSLNVNLINIISIGNSVTQVCVNHD
jgi:mersacidin/lichenicidin family type 2 lantibiotic